MERCVGCNAPATTYYIGPHGTIEVCDECADLLHDLDRARRLAIFR
jgi:hypothetical protein